MKIDRFRITNFKGISDTTVAISGDAPGNIVTLIGLNESGKTTVLEAISHFVTEEKDTANLVKTVQERTRVQDLIPKDRKAAFSDKVSIEALTSLDEDDVNGLISYVAKTASLEVERSSIPRSIRVQRVYRFEDSELKETNTYWTFSFPFIPLTHPS